MNRWLALAKEPDDKARRLPDTRPEPAESPFCPVSAGCGVENIPVKCAPLPNIPLPSQDSDNSFRHGRSAGGNPRTWTGRIVSLDEWRSLSAWNRHGPDGRLFCGICRDWVQPGACPRCQGGAA
jgi:hypothetical protein